MPAKATDSSPSCAGSGIVLRRWGSPPGTLRHVDRIENRGRRSLDTERAADDPLVPGQLVSAKLNLRSASALATRSIRLARMARIHAVDGTASVGVGSPCAPCSPLKESRAGTPGLPLPRARSEMRQGRRVDPERAPLGDAEQELAHPVHLVGER